jgi:hypothetical protein
MIRAFRNFANDLRVKNHSYCPVLTETRGALNIAIGTLQLLTYQLTRYSQNAYWQNISQRHYQIGSAALTKGLKQFVPGAMIAGSAYAHYVYRNETADLPSNAIPLHS